MNRKEERRRKRAAAFKAAHPTSTTPASVVDYDNGPAVRWENRRWTPFVDVTDVTFSRSPVVNSLASQGLDRRKILAALTGDSDSRVYRNSLYQVHKSKLLVAKPHEAPVYAYQLSIRAIDRQARHDWRHFQRIKNELCGPEFEAIEIYPAESRLVDTSNQYYLFVLPAGERVGFGFTERQVMEDVRGSGAEQRPFDPDDRPTDLQPYDSQRDVEALRKLVNSWEDESGPEGQPGRQGETQDPVGEGDRGGVGAESAGR